MADLKIKSKAQLQGGASLPAQSASKALKLDSSGNVTSSVTTDAELAFLSGVTSSVQTQIDSKINLTQKGASNGVATLDAGGKVPSAQLPSTVMEYRGNWNAATNTPTLADGTGDTGDVYRTSVAGTQNLGSGSQTFAVGDWVVYNGSIWQLSPNSNAVGSVFGRVGTVIAQVGDYTTAQVTESGSLYFTDERAQDAVGGILTDTNTIDFTYNDAANTIIADVKTQMSITSDASGVKLLGDAASPGNTQYYGTNAGGTKGFFAIPAIGSAGDLQETSFSAANNVTTATSITGFAFAAGTVRGFKALVSVSVDATADLFETFELLGINKGGTFDMSIEGVGDESGIVFTITSAGQVQYTSANYAGFVSGTVKFRATTTTV